MNKISRQLIKIAAQLDNQVVIEKQEQVFKQYGFDFKKNENGYIAEKTTKFMNYKFTLDLRDAREANTLYPKIIYTAQDGAELNVFEILMRMGIVKHYSKLTQFCIKPLEMIKKQIEWFQALCEDLYKTN